MRINIVSFPEQPEYAQGRYLVRTDEDEYWKNTIDDVVDIVRATLEREERRSRR
jgi:hypothetical protein